MITGTIIYKMGKILLGQVSFYSSAVEKGKKKLFPAGCSLSNFIELTDIESISLIKRLCMLLFLFKI